MKNNFRIRFIDNLLQYPVRLKRIIKDKVILCDFENVRKLNTPVKYENQKMLWCFIIYFKVDANEENELR